MSRFDCCASDCRTASLTGFAEGLNSGGATCIETSGAVSTNMAINLTAASSTWHPEFATVSQYLLGFQRHQRIDPRGAARGQVARDRRNGKHAGGGPRERRNVE